MAILIYFSVLFVINGVMSFNIQSKYGKVSVDPPMNCTMVLNNTKINISDGIVPGLHYGLVQYECGVYKGFILSKPECFDCGIYCPQNDKLLNCRQFTLPYFLGISTALIISVIISIFMHKWGFNWINVFIASMKDNKRVRRENRYAKYISKFNIHNNSIYSPASISAPEIDTPITREKRYPSLSQLAVGTLLLTADRTYACDRTLFMHSNGQICDKSKCQEINSYNFNIGIGKTICFNTPSRDIMKFRIANTKNIITYQQLYDTSDYEIELESVSNCKQTGLCYKEHCYKGAKHVDLKNKTGVHDFDCESEGLGCEFMCWHKYACTWYSWWFKNTGMLASVFKKVSTVWSFELIVTYKDVTKNYFFNSDITQFDLDIGKLFSSDNMPINVNNVIKPQYHVDDYLLRDGFTFYEIDANDINILTPGKIGDYQISIDNSASVYKNNEITCRTTGCKVICSGPEPSLRVYRSSKHKKEVSQFNILDEYTVRSLRHVPITASLSIGNVEFKNLFVEQASCDFSVLETFGCIGCDSMPYAIIQPIKVINHGSLPFISNCTFNTKVLYCSDDMFKLVPVQRYTACNIYIQSLNRSIDIAFKYEFYGELTIPETLYSQDIGFKGIISSIATNSNFIDTLTYGLFAFTGLGVGLSIISKITLRYFMLKKAERIEKNIEMASL